MGFIIGTMLFGKADEIPEVGHVATVFFHVSFVPLIPMQTWFVYDDQEGAPSGGWKGVKIDSSGKSIGLAYLRGLFICGAIWFAINAIPGLSESTGEMLFRGAAAVICLALYIGTYWSGRATLARALELAERARVPRATVMGQYRDS